MEELHEMTKTDIIAAFKIWYQDDNNFDSGEFEKDMADAADHFLGLIERVQKHN